MHLIVEVGPYDEPSLPKHGFGIEEDYLYLAVDNGSNAKGREVNAEQAQFFLEVALDAATDVPAVATAADALNLPIADGMASEVILSNVLGQSDFFGTPEKKAPIICEAHRVLRPGGLITIYENITPPLSTGLLTIVEASGFAVTAFQMSRRVFAWPRSRQLAALDKRYSKKAVDAFLSDESMGAFNSGFFGHRYYIQANKSD